MSARAGLALTLLAAVARGVNLTGTWRLRAAYDETYAVSAADAPATFDARCATGPCSSWKRATLNVTDAGMGRVDVLFDSGLRDAGTVDAAADAISWSSSQ